MLFMLMLMLILLCDFRRDLRLTFLALRNKSCSHSVLLINSKRYQGLFKWPVAGSAAVAALVIVTPGVPGKILAFMPAGVLLLPLVIAPAETVCTEEDELEAAAAAAAVGVPGTGDFGGNSVYSDSRGRFRLAFLILPMEQLLDKSLRLMRTLPLVLGAERTLS